MFSVLYNCVVTNLIENTKSKKTKNDVGRKYATSGDRYNIPPAQLRHWWKIPTKKGFVAVLRVSCSIYFVFIVVTHSARDFSTFSLRTFLFFFTNERVQLATRSDVRPHSSTDHLVTVNRVFVLGVIKPGIVLLPQDTARWHIIRKTYTL